MAVEGAGLGGAAVGVEAVELFGERLCAVRLARGEEFDDVGGDVHAAGGVDARGDAEADVDGGESAVRGILATCMSARRPGGRGGGAREAEG